MEEIGTMLKQNKPDITASSLKAYALNLRKLHQRLHGSKDFSSIDWLQDTEAVLQQLEKHSGSYLTTRNYLNAIIVLLLNRDAFAPALERYQERRDELNQKYTDLQQTKEPSEKQAANWVSVAEIQELLSEMGQLVKELQSKVSLNQKEIQVFQDRFMLTFWLHYPVRNDLQNTRIIARRAFNALPKEDKDNHNFFILGKPIEFSVGAYKTRKKYGVKRIQIEQKPVLKALRDWLRVSPNQEFVLVNLKTKTPMNSLQITQNLTRVFKAHFGKSVGTTLLRHIVLTEKFSKQLQEMEKMADLMGHDLKTAQSVYIKNEQSNQNSIQPSSQPTNIQSNPENSEEKS